MALRMRLIFPYAISGVLAIISFWWFFSRKKDQRRHKNITASSETAQAEDEKKDLVFVQEAGEQTQPLDNEKDVSYINTSCSLSSEVLGNSLFIAASELRSLSGESIDAIQISQCNYSNMINNHATNSIEGIDVSTGFDLGTTLDFHKISQVGNEIEALEGTSQGTNVINTNLSLCGNACLPEMVTKSIETSTLSEDLVSKSVCKGNVHTLFEANSSISEKLNKMSDLLNNDELINATSKTIVFQEHEIVGQESSGVNELVATQICPDEDFQEINLDHDMLVQSATNEIVETCVEEAVVKMSVIVQCSNPVAKEGKIMVGLDSEVQDYPKVSEFQSLTEDKTELKSVLEVEVLEKETNGCLLEYDVGEKGHVEYRDIESVIYHAVESTEDVLPHSCIETIVTSTVSKDKHVEVLNACSQCIEKAEPFSSGDIITDSLKGKTPQFFGDCEAKLVEQLALNIISKVIVAAKQEIMSATESETLDNSCQLLEFEVKDPLKEHSSEQSHPFALEQNNLASGLHREEFTSNSSSCEATEKKSGEVRNSCNVINTSCYGQQAKTELIKNDFDHNTLKEPDLSPVHRSADSFDEAHEIIDDSNMSSCTSEDGIGIEEPLQSTVLSSVGIGSYDSLSTSGIETMQEHLMVSTENISKSRPMENKNGSYSNGDLKATTDLKTECHWTTETDVDQSGGSDVNSMDSVDSGCALKNEQLQNIKQIDAKKAELVIWEIEVPKHLVGRLIGKQGRFVSFLKESSGAKIYISTLPYTQDFQICHIEGSRQQIDKALVLIRKKFKELNLTNIYAPPPCLTLHSLPLTSWHTHPTFHALRSLDQQMHLCYSQPGIPTLPTPVEVGVICAAPAGDDAWWRAQVISFFKDCDEVEIRYVDYGGYEKVKVDILRQIRSDFVTLPFQGAEVLLDNIIPLADEDHFTTEADEAAVEMTRGTALLAQVTNYDGTTGLPLIQLWSMMADEVVSINRSLVERGFAQWIDSF
ncbi:hypothetical protein GDO86_003958 [Hymenochirus boettgeri]|uniref:Tudor domain-containing protein n=1 Tax=Hymenochirus boettgeri TaxID=247094 RepID=A0A8T2K3V4_9PIPI|nr:hypothetical protein GDO86_003958 [Hymenochirus boettgeri]